MRESAHVHGELSGEVAIVTVLTRATATAPLVTGPVLSGDGGRSVR